MNESSAIQLSAADASVTVLSNSPFVTDWCRRYFGTWWNALDVPAEGASAGPLLVADIDEKGFADASDLVNGTPHEEVEYAKTKMLLSRGWASAVTVLSPQEELAYYSTPESGRLVISGRTPQSLALAAARIAREMVRAALLRDGWALLHASGVVHEGRALLAFGSKGAGKTTTALLLASNGSQLLANDRVFVKLVGDELRVLPWPSAAALGLGLLDALGLYGIVRERLQAGEQLHPTQHQDVTDALLADRREPLWEPGGRRERKVQVFPDQFSTWFGMQLATGGRAAAVLFPRIERDATPAVVDGDKSLSDGDFMSGATEDRYPDIFGLAEGINGGGSDLARTVAADRLMALPHRQVVLSHDVAASADFLGKLVGDL